MQNGKPHIWVEFEPASLEQVKHVVVVDFHIVGTGHNVGESWEHCGSMIDGDFVWHVYWDLISEPIKTEELRVL
jgi:hypothetical protein